MKQYLCYYCDVKSDTFQCIIEHLTSFHKQECLKYHELELNEVTGSASYRTKAHSNIIPADGDIVVTADNKVGILKQDRSKKKQLNTPCKVVDTTSELQDDVECAHRLSPPNEGVSEYKSIDILLSEMDIGSPITDDIAYDSSIQELIQLVPVVAEKLRQSGCLDTYSKWCHMMSEDRFPIENICFQLFLNVIEWYSAPNTSEMRYIHDETKQFWEVGYRLFKGKFLRFMAGPRGLGQIVTGNQEKGKCSAVDSNINFAVPFLQTLSKNKLCPIFPGIFDDSITSLSERLPSNIIKIGIDGKKIARGKGDKIGDIDCWGFEREPTLQDKEARQKREKDKVSEVFSLCQKVDIAYVSALSNSYKTTILNELIDILKIMLKRIEDLRHVMIRLDLGLDKFLKLGESSGSNWRKSRFAPVISSLKVSKYDVMQAISSGMTLLNDICHICATLNGCEHLYSYSGEVDLTNQSNYHQLKVNVP